MPAWVELSASNAFGALKRFSPLFTISAITRGLFLKIVPSTRRPPFASVAYARASSSGVTASAPRPIA